MMNVHNSEFPVMQPQPAQATPVVQVRSTQAPDLHYFLSALRRRLQLILLVALVLFSLAAPILLGMTPKYEATASVELANQMPNITGMSQVAGQAIADVPALETEIRTLGSPTVIGRAVDLAGLATDAEFNAPAKQGLLALVLKPFVKKPATPAGPPTREQLRLRAISIVQNNMLIERSGTSFVIDITYESTSPRLAALIANSIADAYLSLELEKNTTFRQRQQGVLKSQLDQQNQIVEGLRATGSDFAGARGVLPVQGFVGAEQDVFAARTRVAEERAAYTQLKTSVDNAERLFSAGQPIIESSPTSQQLYGRMTNARADLESLQTKYGNRHPDVEAKNREIAKLNGEIREEEQRIIAQSRSKADNARVALTSSEQRLAQAEGMLRNQARDVAESKGLEQKALTAESFRENIQTTLSGLATQSSIEQSFANIMAYARKPTSPASPNTPLNMLLALGFALSAGLATAVLAELLERGFSTAETVQAKLGLPVLGTIPTLKSTLKGDKRKGNLRPDAYVVDKPLSGFAESFSNLRTAVLHTQTEQPVRVIAVTSALPGEGKTTTAVCLGKNTALSGVKVVVVDCDARRITRDAMLSEHPKAGLIEVLTGRASLDEALVEDPASGASFLQLSGGDPLPQQIFAGQRMRQLLSQLRQRFDVIILDLPPVLPVAEARVLASYADAVIFVVRWRKTQAKACEHALSKLDMSGAYLAGVALTQVNVRELVRTGYGDSYYYYRSYAPYYSE